MKTFLTSILYLFSGFLLVAQSTFEGHVSDNHGDPLVGANVYLKGTYSGANTDMAGNFKFEATVKGGELLVISYMGYNTHEIEVNKDKYQLYKIKLEESMNSIHAVTITAGLFDAGDEKKAITMRPLDIVTTPSSNGDIYGALNTMPGIQRVGEEGGLFVRGGEGYEAKTYMDGMLVPSPYSSSMPDVPSRGRFSPNLFTGTVFSTGGYSAEYGQALSSALILKTNALPEKDIASFTLLSVGANASYTKRWKNTSLTFDGDYTNLKPYFSIFRQNINWLDAPVSLGGTILLRQRAGKHGMVKSFASFSSGKSSLLYPNYTQNIEQLIKLKNDNIYFNTVYNDAISGNWKYMTGIAFNYDFENVQIHSNRVNTYERNFQFRVRFTNEKSEKLLLKFGAEINQTDYSQIYFESFANREYHMKFDEVMVVGFTEAEVKLSARFAMRLGTRAEFSWLNQQSGIQPRASLARKTGRNGQFSIAYGTFSQSAQKDYRKFNTDIRHENASHYILNYQYSKNDRVFRAEAYHKVYNNLVKFKEMNLPDKSSYTNDGNGFARGLDIFWRDRTSFKNVDYFLTYSYIDTRRNYRDFPALAVPAYISKHNFSMVYKHWINNLNTLVGFSYSFSSGRPYFNPNNPEFMTDRTKPSQDLSMNASYLTTVFGKQAIVHLSVSNVFGFDNVYTYRYSPQQNSDMEYEAHPVKAASKRFVALVFILSLK
jgi:hypothetical protein